MQDVVNAYINEARKLDARYREQAEKVRQDRNLSPEGKAKKLQQIEAERRQAVEAMQAEASAVLADVRKTAQAALDAERRKLSDARRQLLGDALYAQLLQAELSASTADEIRQRYQSASSPWEREVLRSYGSVELRRRTADRAPERAEFAALQELHQGEPDSVREAERALRQLDDFKVAQLDRAAEAQRIASTFGVKAEYVPR